MAMRLSRAALIEIVPQAENDPSVLYWIKRRGTYVDLIGYAELLWPDFHEIDGCVLCWNLDQVEMRTRMREAGGVSEAVEMSVNQIFLGELLWNDSVVATPAQIDYLERLIRDVWGAKLAKDFPDRQFAFHRSDQPHVGPCLTFYQVRNS